jgi:hypothetical protein
MNDDNNGDGNMLSPNSFNMHQQSNNNRYNNRDDRNNSGIPGLGIDNFNDYEDAANRRKVIEFVYKF